MNKEDRKKFHNSKRKIAWRLKRRAFKTRSKPMLSATNIRYQISGRIQAVSVGGIGVLHRLARRCGLVAAIDRDLHLFKRHMPYHESDHVLNLAYNICCGHGAIQDLELLRQQEPYLNLLGAQRIPDPTTAGDFLRRFKQSDIEKLMEIVNTISARMWPVESGEIGIIDVDGLIAPTGAEKKQGIGLSYNGIWGYHPLMVSLANYRQILFIVNRPGNSASQQNAAHWLDKSVALIRRRFDKVLLRGDTAFSLTVNFDRWTKDNVRFVFGFDACRNLIEIAESLPAERFKRLKRPAKYEVQSAERKKRDNVKEQFIVEKEYRNIQLESEDIAEFYYQPSKCSRAYRMIVLRKNLSEAKGEKVLFDDVRYFFYVTNDPELSAEEVVFHANARCNQENLIEQLKNGVNAMRAPVHDLLSNWAYMVIASLAWTLKSWFAFAQRNEEVRKTLLRMEFKAFLNAIVRIPVQVIRQARRVVLSVLAYSPWLPQIFQASLRSPLSSG